LVRPPYAEPNGTFADGSVHPHFKRGKRKLEVFKMVRLFSVLAFLLMTGTALAGDPGLGQPGQNLSGQPVPPPPVSVPPPPPVDSSLCVGVFQGSYFGPPDTLIFQIDAVDTNGDLHAQAWWHGGYWEGQGHCWQNSPWSANIELYFPQSPVHRATIDGRGQYVVMDGRADGGWAFRLYRRQ
jgi:hypothetical protein